MFKKGFSTLTALALSVTCALACWFTQENYENSYFAGVNYFYEHYFNSSDAVDKPITSAYYVNGKPDSNGNVSSYYSVTLPLTPWIKVSPRVQSVDGNLQQFDIRRAKLFYKIVPGNNDGNISSAPWRLAKDVNKGSNPKWRLDFKSPVKLFGENVITKELIESKGDTISAGDGIIMVLWIADNSPGSVTNGQDITPGETSPNIVPTLKSTYNVTFGGSYSPAYVMRVVWNGKILKTGR